MTKFKWCALATNGPARRVHRATLYTKVDAQWLNYSARGGGALQARGWLAGPKLEPERPRIEVGFPTADQGFRAFKALCLAFMAFK